MSIHGALGMSDVPLCKGGRATHAASRVCPCMSLCAHIVARAPQRGTPRGTRGESLLAYILEANKAGKMTEHYVT